VAVAVALFVQVMVAHQLVLVVLVHIKPEQHHFLVLLVFLSLLVPVVMVVLAIFPCSLEMMATLLRRHFQQVQ
jgi:hypothetical protein|tara:strand:+ start:1108 stop:1326 length:219 start_codon:yes stop_codon:yes gene_type:complete